ncbi:MAG: repair protein RecN [Bacillota bacterium]|nr:repair protein RecN [Bacillota bacterium]MDK2855754.1 repair protein RecN [Bacillota bacterium]MDK2924666.1 repair protein RecN [Bacillota bacterium]
MLEALAVHNFALIDNLSLEFEPGLNVLTGETGAGKSIIIDALGVALGERASADYIRSGANSARVEACFSFPRGHPVERVLEAQGIPAEENTLVLTRELNSSGRNVCRVNSHLVTTAQLREIASLLVDIHGQHQHQRLLQPGTHLEFLDAFGGPDHQRLVDEVRSLYERYSQLKATLQDYARTARERAQRQDMLQFQIKEIDAARLREGELEELEEEKRVLVQREKLLTLVRSAYGLLYGGEMEPGALDALGRAHALLQEARAIDKRLAAVEEAVAAALYSLEEVVPELRRYQEDFPLEQGRLEELEERLQLIRTLSRKYGSTIAEILAYRAEAAAELEKLTRAEEDSDTLKGELDGIASQLAARSTDLALARRRLAQILEKKLTAELADLGMAKSKFQIALDVEEDPAGFPWEGIKVRPGPHGFDRAEFLLAANPGEPPRPLAKIASGGELSRVMLAIKTIMAVHDKVPTLIFDEVDAGIGGRAAQAVAAKLAQVSRFHQVICITHLPQIASMGDVHFQIRKEVRGGKTFTEVVRLSPERRVEELGRMLAGQAVTAAVLEHANELLHSSREFKKQLAVQNIPAE